MTIKIGYTVDAQNHIAPALAHEPTFHPKRVARLGLPKTNMCPAITDYDMSAFNVFVPYELHFEVKKQNSGTIEIHINEKKTTLGPIFLNDCFNTTFVSEGILQINIQPFWIFISDEPNVTLMQISAYEQTNPEPIRGQFDCFQWFRPLSYAFEFNYGEEIQITRQSPIYQVKFFHPAESKFSLSECVLTPQIEEHVKGSLLQNFNHLTKWKKVFDFAGKRRPKSVLRFKENAWEI